MFGVTHKKNSFLINAKIERRNERRGRAENRFDELNLVPRIFLADRKLSIQCSVLVNTDRQTIQLTVYVSANEFLSEQLGDFHAELFSQLLQHIRLLYASIESVGGKRRFTSGYIVIHWHLCWDLRLNAFCLPRFWSGMCSGASAPASHADSAEISRTNDEINIWCEIVAAAVVARPSINSECWLDAKCDSFSRDFCFASCAAEMLA